MFLQEGTSSFISPCYYVANEDILFPNLTSVFGLIFSVSSLAWFMSNQETSFVTLGQRVLAYPLK